MTNLNKPLILTVEPAISAAHCATSADRDCWLIAYGPQNGLPACSASEKLSCVIDSRVRSEVVSVADWRGLVQRILSVELKPHA